MASFSPLSQSSGSICRAEKSSGLQTLLTGLFGLNVWSSKGDGTFLKHPDKYFATGEVLIGNKPPSSFLHLHNTIFCPSKGSGVGNQIPGARTALLLKVQEGSCYLNREKIKKYMAYKKSSE